MTSTLLLFAANVIVMVVNRNSGSGNKFQYKHFHTFPNCPENKLSPTGI